VSQYSARPRGQAIILEFGTQLSLKIIKKQDLPPKPAPGTA